MVATAQPADWQVMRISDAHQVMLKHQDQKSGTVWLLAITNESGHHHPNAFCDISIQVEFKFVVWPIYIDGFY